MFRIIQIAMVAILLNACSEEETVRYATNLMVQAIEADGAHVSENDKEYFFMATYATMKFAVSKHDPVLSKDQLDIARDNVRKISEPYLKARAAVDMAKETCEVDDVRTAREAVSSNTPGQQSVLSDELNRACAKK